jgi:hypothetical protein
MILLQNLITRLIMDLNGIEEIAKQENLILQKSPNILNNGLNI